jgi:hypothetical protein
MSDKKFDGEATTITNLSMTPSAEKLAAIRTAFQKNLSVAPSNNDVVHIAYLLRLIETAPHTLTHGRSHRELARAIRIILKVLPQLISEAESENFAAKSEGRATDMDHFAWRAQALFNAAKPFEPITARRDKRGWWHGWARNLALDVKVILARQGVNQRSFSKATGGGTLTVCALLDIAGVQVDAEALVTALRTGSGEVVKQK